MNGAPMKKIKMRRVTTMLEMIGEEAALVIEAVSSTSVRFGGCRLGDVVEMGMAGAPKPDRDASIVHDACSDGALYSGGSRYRLERRG